MTRSPEYRRALDLSKRHHALNKTFSGRLVRRDADLIKQLIVENGAETLLDYGCGKGAQYEWKASAGNAIPSGMGLADFWGVSVAKYDPAVPEFSREPEGSFDIVICTNVLRIIPKTDLGAIIDDIFSRARRAAFFSESTIAATKKPDLRDASIYPTDWRESEWINAIGFRATVPTILAVVVETPAGGKARVWHRLGGSGNGNDAAKYTNGNRQDV